MKSLDNKEERSAFWKNWEEKHENEIQVYQANVAIFYSNDAMLSHIS